MSQLSSEEERREIGVRLSRVRQEAGHSQAKMAKALGVALRTYQSYEQGVREVPGTIYKRLRQQFEVDPGWLLEGDGVGPVRRRAVLDEEIWTKAFWAVDKALGETKLKLSMEKRIRIVQAVYAQAMSSGQVDEAQLATLVSIAA